MGRGQRLHVLEGYVSEVYATDGEVRVDVMGYDPVFKLSQVRVLTGGGLPGSVTYTPPMKEVEEVENPDTHPKFTQNAKVLVLMAGQMPVCVLGCLRNEGELPNTKVSVNTVAPTPSTGDKDAVPSVYDMTAIHRGTYASVSHDGSVTFDMKSSEMPRFRVQLPKSGHMRVSRGGEALERATLAKALKTYMQGDADAGANEATHTELVGTAANIGWAYDLWQRYTDVVEVLKTIFTILDKTALAATAAAGVDTPMTMNAADATSYATARLLFEETSGGFMPPLGPPPLMPNSVISSALRISNDSEG